MCASQVLNVKDQYELMIYQLECFFGMECHVALNRNPGPGHNTPLLRLTPCLHREFHTLSIVLCSEADVDLLTKTRIFFNVHA